MADPEAFLKPPGVRRMKSYSSETGYVYQYYFVEMRRARRRGIPCDGTEYIFAVSSDRKTTFDLPIFLRQDCLDDWAREHGRALTGTEQYGVAKMRLFRAFDEIEELAKQRMNIVVDLSNLGDLLDQLGIA